MNEMFCFQCQQTAHNTGCEGKVGVCGKKSDTSNYQDEIVGALIALANAEQSGRKTENTDRLVLKGLFTTITNVNFNNETIKKIKTEIEKEKSDKEKALSIVKKDWGKDDNVKFTIESFPEIDDNGNCIIYVRDKKTTREISVYKVNIKTGKFTKE